MSQSSSQNYASIEEWVSDNSESTLLYEFDADNLGHEITIPLWLNILLKLILTATGFAAGIVIGLIIYGNDVFEFPFIYLGLGGILGLISGLFYPRVKEGAIRRLVIIRQYRLKDGILYELTDLNGFTMRRWSKNEIQSFTCTYIQERQKEEQKYLLEILMDDAKSTKLVYGFNDVGKQSINEFMKILKDNDFKTNPCLQK